MLPLKVVESRNACIGVLADGLSGPAGRSTRMNWRGRPLVSHEVIVNLIAGTRTRSGLKVRAELDNANYPKGLVVSDEDFAAIKIDRNEFHGDWNYCIRSG